MAPSQAHKDWANLLRHRVGGVISVSTFNDDANTARIAIFTSESPAGIVASTIGLMDIDQSRNPSLELRTELMVHSRDAEKSASNMLATLAFYILKNGWRANPWTIFESMVSMYIPDTNLPHIFFTSPFQWEEWGNVTLGDRVIHPLLAIPVSEAEAELVSNGSGKDLESLWKRRGTDVLNWSRASAV